MEIEKLENTIYDFINAYYEIKENLSIIEDDLNYICENLEKHEMENERLKMNVDHLIQNDRMKQENIENLKRDIEKMKKLFRIMMLFTPLDI